MPTAAFTNFYEVGLKEVDVVINYFEENQSDKYWSKQRLWLDIGLRILVGGFRYYLYYLPQDIKAEISQSNHDQNDNLEFNFNKYCEGSLPVFDQSNKNNITSLFKDAFKINIIEEISKHFSEPDLLNEIDKLIERMVKNRQKAASHCWVIKDIDELKSWRYILCKVVQEIDKLAIKSIREKFQISNKRITKRLKRDCQ